MLTSFLMPTRFKLVFLIEWALYSLLAMVQNRFVVGPIFLNLLWPMVFFYLVGCVLVAVSRSHNAPVKTRKLVSVAVFLAVSDHIVKLAVVSRMAVGESIPLVVNRLHLVHARNMTGSWIAAMMESDPVVYQVLIFSVIFLAMTPLMYRFYSINHRQSFWSETAVVCLMAGLSSAVAELALRGFTVDYFGLPGHFASDLKDILLFVFTGSFVVEALDNPRISFRWKGWGQEVRDVWSLVSRFSSYVLSELRRPAE